MASRLDPLRSVLFVVCLPPSPSPSGKTGDDVSRSREDLTKLTPTTMASTATNKSRRRRRLFEVCLLHPPHDREEVTRTRAAWVGELCPPPSIDHAQGESKRGGGTLSWVSLAIGAAERRRTNKRASARVQSRSRARKLLYILPSRDRSSE